MFEVVTAQGLVFYCLHKLKGGIWRFSIASSRYYKNNGGNFFFQVKLQEKKNKINKGSQ